MRILLSLFFHIQKIAHLIKFPQGLAGESYAYRLAPGRIKMNVGILVFDFRVVEPILFQVVNTTEAIIIMTRIVIGVKNF